MREKIIFLLIVGLLIPYGSLATPLDFHGGVQNEYIYEEIVFVTGEPVKFVGSFKESERDRRGEKTVSYRFTLKEEGGDGSLTRNVSFKTDAVPYQEIGQTTSTTEVDSYRETIVIGGVSYNLVDYQFSKSDIIDSRPASDFYEGNIIARRHYDIGDGQGKVTIDISGGNVGYENFWGSTETLVLDHTISVDRGEDSQGEEGESFTGNYSVQVSDSLTKSFKYSENQTSLSTINGGHVLTSKRNLISSYDYNIKGKTGRIALNQEFLPKIERMIVPKFRDVNGHWAEENIKKLYSLDVFDDMGDVFSPDTNMKRVDFTKAVIRASDIRVEEVEKKRTSRRKTQEEAPYFSDTSTKDENYQYIKAGVDKEIIKGLYEDKFGPNFYLTRAQAITILMRALGYEHKAPNPGYRTSFIDDGSIPNWAKDSIYMGAEIGLVRGDSNNRINPNEYLTRAEASSLLINYLNFLEKGLQKDYRDDIMKY